MSDKRATKIVQMPGAEIGSEALLGAVLEKVKDGSALEIVVGWYDAEGCFNTSWATMANGDLAYAQLCMESDIAVALSRSRE